MEERLVLARTEASLRISHTTTGLNHFPRDIDSSIKRNRSNECYHVASVILHYGGYITGVSKHPSTKE